MKFGLKYSPMEHFAKMGLTAVAVSAILASMALAADGPSLEKGKNLFDSTKLGSNGKSCASCHLKGKGLQNVASYDAEELGNIVNRCIEGPLEGDGLAPESDEMKSLIVYINSFAGKTK